jgi:CheY-like chemotaxis protein
MPDVTNRCGGAPALEALPGRPREPRVTRLSADEPPANRDAPVPGPGEVAAERQPRLPRVLRGVRVLVVDDDEETAELFSVALRTCGAEVVTAFGAREALSRLVERRPDVVVTDIAMPGADGYWLLQEIRQLADAAARAVPVLAVTAFGREHFRARAMAAGFADHLVKPLDPEALCLAVARARSR